MDQANARMDVPNPGQILIPQLCILRRSTNQLIAKNVPTLVSFTTVIADDSPDGLAAMFSAGAPTKITLNEDGYWTFFGSADMETDASIRYHLWVRIKINGAIHRGRANKAYAGAIYSFNPFGSRVLSLNDYIELEIFHDHTSDLNLNYALLGVYRNQDDK